MGENFVFNVPSRHTLVLFWLDWDFGLHRNHLESRFPWSSGIFPASYSSVLSALHFFLNEIGQLISCGYSTKPKFQQQQYYLWIWIEGHELFKYSSTLRKLAIWNALLLFWNPFCPVFSIIYFYLLFSLIVSCRHSFIECLLCNYVATSCPNMSLNVSFLTKCGIF